MRSARLAVLLDVCCVLVFVVIGRASHTEGETPAGIVSTAWPFLCGLAAGWAFSRAWRRPLALRSAGLPVWLFTVALGMVLRLVSGQGTAAAFVVVALAFLALFLLGWRLLARLVSRTLSTTRSSGPRWAGGALTPDDGSARLVVCGGGGGIRAGHRGELFLCAGHIRGVLPRLQPRVLNPVRGGGSPVNRRLLFMTAAVSAFAAALWALPAAASALPSGERIVGGTASAGGTVVEPVYDDMTGQIRYVSTPRGTPFPVKSNPVAAAPFYLPVYPAGSTVGVTLNCQDVPTENCPDHGPAVAGLAEALDPGVYGGGVLGHDHLMAGPASGGDFNVAWVPVLVLFTSSAAANTHITTLAQLNAMIKLGKVTTVPLDGSNGLPNLTFHCSVVSAAVYARGVPFVG